MLYNNASEIEGLKFCKDCRWAKRIDKAPVCTHPESGVRQINLVTGERDHILMECELVRSFEGRCKKEALLWEPPPLVPKARRDG